MNKTPEKYMNIIGLLHSIVMSTNTLVIKLEIFNLKCRLDGLVRHSRKIEDLQVQFPALHVSPSPQDAPAPHIQTPPEHVSPPAHVISAHASMSR